MVIDRGHLVTGGEGNDEFTVTTSEGVRCDNETAGGLAFESRDDTGDFGGIARISGGIREASRARWRGRTRPRLVAWPFRLEAPHEFDE